MRKSFIIAILCLATLYTYQAFSGLSFLSSTGRLGPGFFPRIIGIGLVLACIAALAQETRQGSEPPRGSDTIRDTVVVGALTLAFVALLDILGGPIAMVVFLLASLFFLNRKRPVQNLTIALILPALIWLMFDYWLNAAMPEGMIIPALFA